MGSGDTTITLDELLNFFSKQDVSESDENSIQERADSAINLLQSLPCARHAILDKLGEVFFADAKDYVIESERLHVAGLPLFNQFPFSKQAEHIGKIQDVLVSAITCNPSAWCPMIFQWSIHTLSEICSEFSEKRHLAQFGLNERFNLWLDCLAAKVLLEITISCLREVIVHNSVTCLKILLNCTLACTPYLDWAFCHLCYLFSEYLPYHLLHFALESFSSQSRRVEVIIDTLIVSFNSIFEKKPEAVTHVILRLFKESLTDEKKSDSNHTVLCIVPFLLHVCTKSPQIFLPLVDDVLSLLHHENLMILSKQSGDREDILQRGLLRRIVDVIKLLDRSAYDVTQYLMRYAFKLDDKLNDRKPELAKEMQVICFNILEYILLYMTTDLHAYLHNSITLKHHGDGIPKTEFFTSLSKSFKKLSRHILHSNGLSKQKYRELIMFTALQEGEEKMLELIEFCLFHLNAGLECVDFELFYDRFQLWSDNIVEKTLKRIFVNAPLLKKYSEDDLLVLFQTIRFYLTDERKDSKFIPIFSPVNEYVKEISQVLVMSENERLTEVAFELLNTIHIENLRVPDIAVLTRHVLKFYFDLIGCLNNESKSNWQVFFKNCEKLFANTIKSFRGTQQLIMRAIVEYILNTSQTDITLTQPEQTLVKVELLKKNVEFGKNSHFANSGTAVDYRDGLSLLKRKVDKISTDVQFEMDQHLFLTLSAILSTPDGFTNPSTQTKFLSFKDAFLYKENLRVFPSAHTSLASILFENVCPEINAKLPWPDEDFLKYTMERDLKISNIFAKHDILWNILELIANARPSLFHCGVIMHSLFGVCLKYWCNTRHVTVDSRSTELKRTSRILYIFKLAGWLPQEFDTIADVFHLIKPKEVYHILSAVWKYLQLQNFSPERFMERDNMGRPQIITNREHIANVQAVIKVIFLKNIHAVGGVYARYLADTSSA